MVGSRSLRKCDVLPKLQFLISFYVSFEQVLVAVKRNYGLLNVSLERVIEPNIALLRQFGVRGIAQLCSNSPRLLPSRLENLKDLLLRAEELGVPRTSRMFKYAVSLVAGYSREKLAAKLEFFKRYLGCSEFEISVAMSKMPSILGISDKNLTRKIEFLVDEVEMEPQYILERPVLLGLSLEKRLIPRHRVMKALQTKGLLNSNMTYFTFAKMGEGAFILKFIDCHEDCVPGLAAYYAKGCAGDVPPEVQLLS
jgi:mTERF domain-containing protein